MVVVNGYGFNAFKQLAFADVIATETPLRTNVTQPSTEAKLDQNILSIHSGYNSKNRDCHNTHIQAQIRLCWSYSLHLDTGGRVRGYGYGWSGEEGETQLPRVFTTGHFSHIAASDLRIACVCIRECNNTPAHTQLVLTSTVHGSLDYACAPQSIKFHTAQCGEIVQVAVCMDIVYVRDESGGLWRCAPSEAHFTKVVTSASITDLACGLSHILLLTQRAEVLVMGSNRYGQLGLGFVNQEVTTPTILEALQGVRITALAAGAWHSMALSRDGDVYTWGNAADGQLGRPKEDTALPGVVDWPVAQQESTTAPADEFEPPTAKKFKSQHNAARSYEPATLQPDDVMIVDISAGRTHSVAVDSMGRAWGFGSSKYGQLGQIAQKTIHPHMQAQSDRNLDLTQPEIRVDAQLKVSSTADNTDTTDTPRVFEFAGVFKKVQKAICGAWNTVLLMRSGEECTSEKRLCDTG